jgi:hypothetical protein
MAPAPIKRSRFLGLDVFASRPLSYWMICVPLAQKSRTSSTTSCRRYRRACAPHRPYRRAGAAGTAIALCSPDERPLLRNIERVTRQTIPVEDRSYQGNGHATSTGSRRPAWRIGGKSARGYDGRRPPTHRPAVGHGGGRTDSGGAAVSSRATEPRGHRGQGAHHRSKATVATTWSNVTAPPSWGSR